MVSFNQLAITSGILASYLVDYGLASSQNWRLMFGLAAIPAILMFTGMLFQQESPHWLVAKGRTVEGEKATTELLKRTPQYPKNVSLGHLADEAKIKASEGHGSYLSLFKKKNRRATILASVPWFLQDLGVSPNDVSMAVGFGFAAPASGQTTATSAIMFVFRARGADGNRLVAGFKTAALSSGQSPVQWANANVGGKQVESATQSGQLVYLYVKNDVLFFIGVGDEATAQTILSGLP